MNDLKKINWQQILCESLYATKEFRHMGCIISLNNEKSNRIQFEGINGETPNFLDKDYYDTNIIENQTQFKGKINIKENNIIVLINNEYYEEYKLIEDNKTGGYYIINILSKILSNGEKKLIGFRNGYFNANLFSYQLIEILKNIILIDWDFYDIENFPNENLLRKDIRTMTKGMSK